MLGTQTIATLIAVYGLFMAPLGWKWAGFVWAYAIAWALINDRIKLLAYKIFDPVKADAKAEGKTVAKPEGKIDESKPAAKDKPKVDTKADQPKAKEMAPPAPEGKAEALKPEAKPAEPKTEAKAEAPKTGAKEGAPKTEPATQTKAPSNLTSQIAGRAYELYEHRAPNGGTAVQDWQKAEQELRKDETNGQPKPEAKPDEPKHEAAAEPEPEAKDKPQPDVSPQLVKRVHEAYEQLGRKDVQSVQDWEKAHAEVEEHDAHK